MEDLHLYTSLFRRLDSALTGYVNDTATNVMAEITPTATTLLIVYVSMWGMMMLLGRIQEPVMDGATRIIRLGLITGIALYIGNYNQYVSDVLWATPDALAAVVSGAGASSGAQAQFLDALMSKMYDFGVAFLDAGEAQANSFGIPNVNLTLAGGMVIFAGVAVTAYGAFLYALSKVALAVLLAIGPIFIVLSMFDATRKFLDAWIGQVLNYVIMIVLAAAVMATIVKVLQAYLVSPGAVAAMQSPELSDMLPAAAFAAIGVLVLAQIPSIASALGGGVAIGTLGVASVAWRKATGAATGAGRGAWNLGTGRSLSDMRSARRARQTNARWAERNPSAPVSAYRKITRRWRGRE